MRSRHPTSASERGVAESSEQEFERPEGRPQVPCGRGEDDHEHGSMSVLMLALLVIAFVLCFAGVRLGEAAVARARAQAAADAAALAAADHLALGYSEEVARRAASDTAEANGARLVRCECGGLAAEVDVEIDAIRTARARARAEINTTL